MFFPTNSIGENWITTSRRLKRGLSSLFKINSKWIEDLNVKL
jgi:hypothetical protein